MEQYIANMEIHDAVNSRYTANMEIHDAVNLQYTIMGQPHPGHGGRMGIFWA
jgi:hypothetical protein